MYFRKNNANYQCLSDNFMNLINLFLPYFFSNFKYSKNFFVNFIVVSVEVAHFLLYFVHCFFCAPLHTQILRVGE